LKNVAWRRQTYALSYLREQAESSRENESILRWLTEIGVIPQGTKRVGLQKFVNLDPEAINAYYLASVANEWDSLGPSTPLDFVKALSFETVGECREGIVALLESLGRSLAHDDAVDNTVYHCHVGGFA